MRVLSLISQNGPNTFSGIFEVDFIELDGTVDPNMGDGTLWAARMGGAGYYYRNVYHIEAEEITITTVIYGKRLFGTSDQALTANKTHRPRGLNKFRVAYIVTRFFFHNGVHDKVDDLFARGAGANKVAEVVFGG